MSYDEKALKASISAIISESKEAEEKDDTNKNSSYITSKDHLYAYGLEAYDFIEKQGFKDEKQDIYAYCDFIQFCVKHPHQLTLQGYQNDRPDGLASKVYTIAENLNSYMCKEYKDRIKKLDKKLAACKNDEEKADLEKLKKENIDDLDMLSKMSTKIGKSYYTINWTLKHVLSPELFKKARMPY